MADDFHYIHSFYGPRASGMGGAFTAISDDASGTYYNPAGLSFAYNDSISINATSYQITKKDYHNIFGPWQDYNQVSRKYLPDFVGTVMAVKKFKLGFSVVNGINDSYDQSNKIYLPASISNIASLDVGFMQEKFNILIGPSASYLFTDKLSLGATLYYMYDTSKSVSKRVDEKFTADIASLELQERRETRGFLPVIGMQYVITQKIVMGLTYRKTFITGGTIHQKETLIETQPLLANIDPALTNLIDGYMLVSERNDTMSTVVLNNYLVLGTPITYKIPELNQFNLGFAFFQSKKLIMSVDFMYVTPYKYYLPQVEFDPHRSVASFSSPTKNNLERKATHNYAIGAEYYLTDRFILRAGLYTNRSNGKVTPWGQTALELALNDQLGGNFTLPLNSNLNYIYLSNRQEYVNKHGYTLGFGFMTSNSSIAFNVVKENGSGGARIEEAELPHKMLKSKTTFYVNATRRY